MLEVFLMTQLLVNDAQEQDFVYTETTTLLTTP